MARRPRQPVPGSAVDVARALLVVQGAVAATAALEVAVWAAFGMPVGVPVLLTGGAALLTLALAAGVGRRSRLARRLVILAEVAWVALALVDMALAVALARRGLELVPVLTRILLPLAVVRLLRRPGSRREFGVRLSRRQRRRAAAAVAA